MITLEHRQEANRIADAYAQENTRSAEHMNGFRAAMAWWIAKKPKGQMDTNPYQPGTCQWEAWSAGVQSGIEITSAWEASRLPDDILGITR